jgi:hypothetical protein
MNDIEAQLYRQSAIEAGIYPHRFGEPTVVLTWIERNCVGM